MSDPVRVMLVEDSLVVRELLRHVRIDEGRDPSYAVAWPDHPPVVQQGSAA